MAGYAYHEVYHPSLRQKSELKRTRRLLLKILETRSIATTSEQRRRINYCKDLEQLQQLLNKPLNTDAGVELDDLPELPPVPDRLAEWGDGIWQADWTAGFLEGFGYNCRGDEEEARLYTEQHFLALQLMARRFEVTDRGWRYIRDHGDLDQVREWRSVTPNADSLEEVFGFDINDLLEWP